MVRGMCRPAAARCQPGGTTPAPLSRGTTAGARGARDRRLAGDTLGVRPASPALARAGSCVVPARIGYRRIKSIQLSKLVILIMALRFALSLDIQDGSCHHDKRAGRCGRLRVVVPCLPALGGMRAQCLLPGEWKRGIGPDDGGLRNGPGPGPRSAARGEVNCGLCMAIDVPCRCAVRRRPGTPALRAPAPQTTAMGQDCPCCGPGPGPAEDAPISTGNARRPGRSSLSPSRPGYTAV